MKTDKEVKADFKARASVEPEKNYPVEKLKEYGFHRGKCKNCGKFFWSQDQESKICGDAECSGGYSFIGNPPTKKGFDYLETWDAYKKYFKKLGYYEYERYPVVARWRQDVYWVGASVYPFQPYVVKGEIKPKSNAVIIPQLSLRFNDIDNVGITGSHYVCFDMLGQLHFEQAKDYDMPLYWDEYFNWIVKGMGIPQNELTIHEDAWAGGGTFGPCMEFFARGMEIGNQVYMQYEQTESGYKELEIKVLDMGQGHERVPWLTTGKSNSYETTFPSVAKKLYKITGYKPDDRLMQKFLPYSALLNVDEVSDIEKVWQKIAKEISIDVKELKESILPLAAIYSIGEHSRAALVALNDNALPSNVGGGYNLRIILRRALGFVDDYNWDIDLSDLTEDHALFLKPMYPELSEKLDNVSLILENEKKKFLETKKRSRQVIANLLLKEKKPSIGSLMEVYDSHGVRPEQIMKEVKGTGVDLEIPDDFYSLVAERHEKHEQVIATKKEEKLGLSKQEERSQNAYRAFEKKHPGGFDIGVFVNANEMARNLPETKILYYDDWSKTEFVAKVVSSKDDLVALDKTVFYPTSGGQLHDLGSLNGAEVIDVFKQGNIILHRLEKNSLKVGDKVKGKIDSERRKQLMQHHSSAHLMNLCSFEVLGPHVWQAGASKTLEKGRLDITHFDQLTEKELKKIEACCNEKIKKNLKVKSEILPREKAEDKFGMHIYQGGFVPGRNLRIVTIGSDSEACGGTHANSLGELEELKIISSTKVQDGIIRINYTAGKAARKEASNVKEILLEEAKILGVKPAQVTVRHEELFSKWKKARKSIKTGNTDVDLELVSKGEIQTTPEKSVAISGAIFSTQPEHLPRVTKRFLDELEEMKKKLQK